MKHVLALLSLIVCFNFGRAQHSDILLEKDCEKEIITLCFSGQSCDINCPADEVRISINGIVTVIKNGSGFLDGYETFTSGDCRRCYTFPADLITERENNIELLLDLNCSVKSGSCEGCTFEGQREAIVVTQQDIEPCPICVVRLEDKIICEGDSTLLAPDTGGKEVDYLWSTGETTPTILVSDAETYGVTVTDARGCSAKASATVVVNESYVIEESIELCIGDSIEEQEVKEDFFYIRELETHLGCDSFVVIEVKALKLPSIELEKDKSISCFGGNNGRLIAISEDSTSFSWSNGSTGATVDSLSAGTYSVTATDENGCSTVDSFLLVEPDSLGMNFEVDSISCHGAEDGVIRLDGFGGKAPYFFSGEGVHQYGPVELKDLAPGTYILSVSDEPECVTVDSVTITEPTEISLSIETKHVTCFGSENGELNLSATGGTKNFSFEILPGNSTMSLSSGIYSIFATDGNGCEEVSEVEVEEPEPLSYSEISIVPTACNERTGAIEIETSGGTGVPFVQWANGQSGSSLEGLEEGAYFGTITDENGCSIEIQPISVKVLVEKELYFPNVFSPNGDGRNDTFFPMGGECSGVEEIDLSIFDRWGERVFDKTIKPNDRLEGWDGMFKRKPMDSAVFSWVATIQYEDGKVLKRAGDIQLSK